MHFHILLLLFNFLILFTFVLLIMIISDFLIIYLTSYLFCFLLSCLKLWQFVSFIVTRRIEEPWIKKVTFKHFRSLVHHFFIFELRYSYFRKHLHHRPFLPDIIPSPSSLLIYPFYHPFHQFIPSYFPSPSGPSFSFSFPSFLPLFSTFFLSFFLFHPRLLIIPCFSSSFFYPLLSFTFFQSLFLSYVLSSLTSMLHYFIIFHYLFPSFLTFSYISLLLPSLLSSTTHL